jgi:alpha-D-xyloside xylohydrolase
MKFSNGIWLNKKGLTISSPKEAYSVEMADNSLTVYAPYSHITHKGRVIDTGLMTIRFSSPATDVICVSAKNHIGRRERVAQFSLNTVRVQTTVMETDTHYVFGSGSTEAYISKLSPWDISFYRNGVFLTASGKDSLAHIEASDGKTYMREQLTLSPGECVYGLGERFTAFVKNGQSVETWNADGGADTEQAYKCVPFYITSKNYGVFVNNTDNVSYEIGSERVDKAQFSVPGECLEYFVISGEDIKSVICTYTDLTGKPALPPVWSFGLWLSTSFSTEYDEETIMAFVEGMQDRGLPVSVLHIDCFWMREFEWTSFVWDKERFPDPVGMIRRLHERGLKVCLWINPYVGQKSPLFREGLDMNYFVNTGSGSVWQCDGWQAGMALIDFTNNAARTWYQKYVEELLKMGVDSVKTDFGERIPTKNSFFGSLAETQGIVFHNGVTPESMHNYYSYLYNQVVFEVLERRFGKSQALLFARSGTAGSQKMPVHWSGDSLSSYASMAATLRGGLSLSLCGFGFWSHDIGGFEAGATPDLFMRWTQFGLLSSHSRLHGSEDYKLPWLYGEEAVEVTKLFTRLKLRFMPYLYAAAVDSSATGIPVMRPMMMEFPKDETCRHLDRQYMLGASLLCAPVFSPDGIVSYYVPAGQWTNVLTRERVTGPCWRTEQHDYYSLPLLARDNSILVTGKTDTTPDYDYLDSVTVTLYDLHPEEEAFAEIFSAGGQRSGMVRARISDGHLVVRSEGLTGICRLMIANEYNVGSSSEGIPEQTEWGTVIDFTRTTLEVELL